jgi:hypothetical protein
VTGEEKLVGEGQWGKERERGQEAEWMEEEGAKER